MNHVLEFVRPVIAIVGASGLWLADQVVTTISPPPAEGWGMLVDKYGLPLVLLALSIYGGVGMYKALRASEKARMDDIKASEAARVQDAKDTLAQYRLDAVAAEISRRELIREIKAQTNVIRENRVP